MSGDQTQRGLGHRREDKGAEVVQRLRAGVTGIGDVGEGEWLQERSAVGVGAGRRRYGGAATWGRRYGRRSLERRRGVVARWKELSEAVIENRGDRCRIRAASDNATAATGSAGQNYQQALSDNWTAGRNHQQRPDNLRRGRALAIGDTSNRWLREPPSSQLCTAQLGGEQHV